MNGHSVPDIHEWQHIEQMYQADNTVQSVDRMKG